MNIRASVISGVVMMILAFQFMATEAQAQPAKKFKFDEDGTPLARSLQEEIYKAGGDPTRGKKFKTIKVKKGCNPKNKNCVPEVELVCEDCGDIRDGDRLLARKKRSELEVTYDFENTGNPNPLRIRVPTEAPVPDEAGAGLVQPGSGLSYTRFGPPPGAVGPGAGADVSCVDQVTGAQVSNDDCFESNAVKANLSPIAGAEIRSCVHTDPTNDAIQEIIFEPELTPAVDGVCFDAAGEAKSSSLVPLLAEAELFGKALCEDLANNLKDSVISPDDVDYVEENGEGFCDFTRAYMVKANEADKSKGKDPRFLTDENGDPINPEDLPKDDNGKITGKYKNAKRYGEFTRTARIREDFTLKCRGNHQLIGDRCWDIDYAARNFSPAQLRAAEQGDPEALASLDFPARSESNGMLMGFTWAPPVEEWGYEIVEEECVLGVCVELLEARIGYKFDVAAGLRFPIDVTIDDLPPETNSAGDSVIAESVVTVKASVEPADWTVGEFKAYCNDNNLPYDCEDRFAFPEFFDSLLNDLAKPLGLDKDENEVDGSEAVARADVFIGGKLEVLGIELLGLYLGADVDIMTACSAVALRSYFTENGISPDAAIDYDGLKDIFGGENVAKSLGLICGSFTTPFGADDGFTLAEFTIPASCDDAQNIPFTKTSKKPAKKLCSKLELEKKGAKLGIDLILGFGLTGNRITSKADVGLDGCRQSATSTDSEGRVSCSPTSKNLSWTPADLEESFVINADNFDSGQNFGRLVLSDFNLDLVPTVSLGAALNFGGVLDLIPNIGLDLYTLVLPAPAISIGQHDDEVAIGEKYFVRNYALSVDGQATVVDSELPPKTLLVKPGEEGEYAVRVRNLGSVVGDFDNFRAALSTRPGQSAASYSFIINPNNDFDCTDSVDAQGQRTGDHFIGNPYDNIPDGCYDAQGQVLPGRIELIDEDGLGPERLLYADQDDDGDGVANEDPVDTWVAAFEPNLFIGGVAPNTSSFRAGKLNVIPFKHPLTRPGVYPVQILADSVEAKSNNLAATDPVGQARTNAEDVVFFQVVAFYDPQVVAQALTESAKPGVGKSYTIEVANGSNVVDSITVDTTRVDSNQVGCTLTTLGNAAECPYRATPTAIPLAWTSGELPTSTGPLVPLGVASNQLAVNVPGDWAGIEDTTYQVVFTVTSTADPESPKASNQVTIEQTVTATMESMTRYIGLELAELIAVLDAVNERDIRTAGLKPISINAVQRTNNRALESILAGNLRAAGRSHATNIRIMEGFARALAGSGKSLDPALVDDLNARAAAIITDMTRAESSQIPSK